MICTESPISSEDIYNNDLINNINIKDLIKINDFEYDQDNHDLDLFNDKIDILESFNEKENIIKDIPYDNINEHKIFKLDDIKKERGEINLFTIDLKKVILNLRKFY